MQKGFHTNESFWSDSARVGRCLSTPVADSLIALPEWFASLDTCSSQSNPSTHVRTPTGTHPFLFVTGFGTTWCLLQPGKAPLISCAKMGGLSILNNIQCSMKFACLKSIASKSSSYRFSINHRVDRKYLRGFHPTLVQ